MKRNEEGDCDPYFPNFKKEKKKKATKITSPQNQNRVGE